MSTGTRKKEKTSSVDAFNKLLAENISKRFSPKKLPPPDDKYQLTDDSLKVDINDTFDKLRMSADFNKVNFKDGDVFNLSSTLDSDKSNIKLKEPTIHVSNIIHSPLTKKRRKKTKLQKNTIENTSPKLKTETSKDKPLIYSLEIELRRPPYDPSKLVLSADSNVESTANASYKPIFTDSFRSRLQIAPQVTSTPNEKNQQVKPNLTGILSPCVRKLRNDTVLETTYSEIQNWDRQLSSRSFCDDSGTPSRALVKIRNRFVTYKRGPINSNLQLTKKFKNPKYVAEVFKGFDKEDQLHSLNVSKMSFVHSAVYSGCSKSEAKILQADSFNDISYAEEQLNCSLLEKSMFNSFWVKPHSTPKKVVSTVNNLEKPTFQLCPGTPVLRTLRSRKIKARIVAKDKNPRISIPENKKIEKKSNLEDPKLSAKCVVNVVNNVIDPKLFKPCVVVLPKVNFGQKSDSDIFASDSNNESRLFSSEIQENEKSCQENCSNSNKVESVPELMVIEDKEAIPHHSVTSGKCDEIISISSDDEEETRKTVQFEFRIPENLPKTRKASLKPGKPWRRSLSLLRAEVSVLDVSGDFCSKGNGLPCECNICSKNPRQSLRMSVKIIPDIKRETKLEDFTPLEKFAILNAGYGCAADEENKALEATVRELSLKIRQSLNVNDTPAVTARDLVLRKCGQIEPLPFEQCYPKRLLKNCQKIGEGVYGEVYLFRKLTGGTCVMKIIPIEGEQIVNGDKQMKFEQIITEIVIATELSALRYGSDNRTSSFCEVENIRCVKGCYPDTLLELWDEYNEVYGSENDSPECFGPSQLYITLELANGGKDLESYKFENAQQTFALFQQVACALAVAESELQFEHRDLHWGNILVSTCSEMDKTVSFRLDGKEIDVLTYGVEATIIDFTLSRISHGGVVIYHDIAHDEDLFGADGDYQFEIYRLMRNKNENVWSRFQPYTNILWLHYMLDKLILGVHYEKTKTRLHKVHLAKLLEMKEMVLQFDSVKSLVGSLFG